MEENHVRSQKLQRNEVFFEGIGDPLSKKWDDG